MIRLICPRVTLTSIDALVFNYDTLSIKVVSYSSVLTAAINGQVTNLGISPDKQIICIDGSINSIEIVYEPSAASRVDVLIKPLLIKGYVAPTYQDPRKSKAPHGVIHVLAMKVYIDPKKEKRYLICNNSGILSTQTATQLVYQSSYYKLANAKVVSSSRISALKGKFITITESKGAVTEPSVVIKAPRQVKAVTDWGYITRAEPAKPYIHTLGNEKSNLYPGRYSGTALYGLFSNKFNDKRFSGAVQNILCNYASYSDDRYRDKDALELYDPDKIVLANGIRRIISKLKHDIPLRTNKKWLEHYPKTIRVVYEQIKEPDITRALLYDCITYRLIHDTSLRNSIAPEFHTKKSLNMTELFCLATYLDFCTAYCNELRDEISAVIYACRLHQMLSNEANQLPDKVKHIMLNAIHVYMRTIDSTVQGYIDQHRVYKLLVPYTEFSKSLTGSRNIFKRAPKVSQQTKYKEYIAYKPTKYQLRQDYPSLLPEPMELTVTASEWKLKTGEFVHTQPTGVANKTFTYSTEKPNVYVVAGALDSKRPLTAGRYSIVTRYIYRQLQLIPRETPAGTVHDTIYFPIDDPHSLLKVEQIWSIDDKRPYYYIDSSYGIFILAPAEEQTEDDLKYPALYKQIGGVYAKKFGVKAESFGEMGTQVAEDLSYLMAKWG